MSRVDKLSKNKGNAFCCLILKSSKKDNNQTNSQQHEAIALYFASTIIRAIIDWFLDFQLARSLPNFTQKSLTEHRVSKQLP